MSLWSRPARDFRTLASPTSHGFRGTSSLVGQTDDEEESRSTPPEVGAPTGWYSLYPGGLSLSSSLRYHFCVEVVLDLEASINDSTSDVQKVVYVVHAPVGTRLVTLVNTDGLMGLKETVQFSATDAANTYDTSTTVYTGQKGVGVTASTKVLSALGVTLGFGSTAGVNGKALLIHIVSLL